MQPQTYLLAIFAVTILGFLVADLGYFNRKAHKIPARSALLQSLFWIAVALGYAVLIHVWMGRTVATEFLSAYVTEKMLSVDNLFVIALIFNYFNLEEKYHHRVLFWGILGAIVFRGVFIAAGSYIVQEFHWVLYVFGAILVLTGIKLLREQKEEHVDYEQNQITKLARKFLPFTNGHHSGKFAVRENGKLLFTSLFLVLLLVETTDIIFAFDSIPAAFAISQNPFVVFTSNIFAIMGLRALFFLLENILHKFHHLQKGLSFVLVFIGVKMLLGIVHVHISSAVSLLIILGALCLSLLLSALFPKKI